MVSKATIENKYNRRKMSIETLIKMNENSIGGILRLDNYEILTKDNENNIDTYIVEKDTGMGGIALLGIKDDVIIILGDTTKEDKSITIDEFNKKYEIYEKY